MLLNIYSQSQKRKAEKNSNDNERARQIFLKEIKEFLFGPFPL
jgi:hypothetical protein